MTDTSTPSLKQLSIQRTAPGGPKRRRWGLWVGAALAVVAVGAFVLRPGKTEVQVTSVVTTYPSQQYAQLTASGYVVAQRRAAVASKATGRLEVLNVREGSLVKQGDVLARLDASDVRAALAQAGVERTQAEADLKRQQALQAKGFVSPQTVETAMTRVNATQAAMATAEAAVAVARAQLKVQQVNLDYTEIRAPFDGVVLVKSANVGDIITPFSSAAGAQGAVVTMADMGTLEVEADVSESNLAKAKIGQPVEITLDALPDARFRGSVVGIVPTVDRAKATVMTKIRFEKLDPRILPEMSAKVTILSQPATDADQKPLLAVNPKAVVERDGRKQVLRVKDDTVEAVDVTPGRRIGDNLEITGALKSGDKVVLSPPDKLAGGMKIAVAAK
ncbi:efflux RND transporter periplasmic adaptor subunit [Candidatus Skiveiella danica]|uniref:efflux RND transporter periplasmic adaptor subunit n=1 Tax=Candidatus Skiveiella danica TaxID=3386177 RepID=UPI0009C797F5|nr:MAG: Macrolide export protein MacA [Alphaproteobacteria bacterium ADurb.Bin100]